MKVGSCKCEACYASMGYGNMSMVKTKPAADPEEWLQKDGMALSLIQPCVNKSQLHHIRNAETSKPAWDDLQKINEKSRPLQIYQLYKKLSHTKLGTNQSLQQHFKTFEETLDRLKEAKVVIPSELATVMLLDSLSPEYEQLCLALAAGDTKPEMKVIKVK